MLGEGGMAFGGMETRAETEGKGTGGMRGGGVCVAGDINPLLVKGGEKGKKSIMCVAVSRTPSSLPYFGVSVLIAVR